jgi:hypothetical protein
LFNELPYIHNFSFRKRKKKNKNKDQQGKSNVYRTKLPTHPSRAPEDTKQKPGVDIRAAHKALPLLNEN